MLSGALKIETCGNGWILSWYEMRSTFTSPGTLNREVYGDATACVRRIAEVIGMQVGAGAARAFTDLVEGYEPTYTGPAPAADPVLAEMLPPNAPPNALAGD